MIDGQKVIAIIPARAGSKRLPNKNRKSFTGMPLISVSIVEAKKSKYIDEIIVTSDDEAIIKIADDEGVTAILRPEHLSSDIATSNDVVEHAISAEVKRDFIVLLLQPTSPLRTSSHIDGALELLMNKDIYSVVSVCETEHSPLWTNTLSADMSMDNFFRPEIINSRSQDLPKYYRLNGAIYAVREPLFKEQKSFILNKGTIAYEMEQIDSVDIDTQLDFDFAEMIYIQRRI